MLIANRLAMRQLLRHCCKAAILSELQTGVSRFRFPSIPAEHTGNFYHTVTHTTSLYVSHFSLLLFFLLRSSLLCSFLLSFLPLLCFLLCSSHLCSVLLSFLPLLCFLLRSSHLWSVLLSFLPSLSQPPTDTCSVTATVTGDHLKLRS